MTLDDNVFDCVGVDCSTSGAVGLVVGYCNIYSDLDLLTMVR